jgi:hypothetical protein
VGRATGRSYRHRDIPIAAITWVSDVTKTIFLVDVAAKTAMEVRAARVARIDDWRGRRDARTPRAPGAETMPQDHG